MSSWHNRQRRRMARARRKVAIMYIFKDGITINDYGDGKGQKQAVERLFATKIGYTVDHVSRRVA